MWHVTLAQDFLNL